MIATSTKVDLKGLDSKAMEKVSGDSYFSREKKSQKQKGEEKFMNQGKEQEVRHTSKTSPTPMAVLGERQRLTRSTEEADTIRASIRPEVHRQANPVSDQEGGDAGKLPQLELQSAPRTATTRDEILDYESHEVGEAARVCSREGDEKSVTFTRADRIAMT